ncbi:gap junction delta-4 protein [Esox lucius]|nr:gap junction delta-4 protein [Esox lucius]
MISLRVLVLLFAGYPLYQDEQERFVCNTIQPGCANVCYDIFAPVSLFRFYLVQLVLLCLPFSVFVAYVVHEVTTHLAIDTTHNSVGAGLLYRESFRKTTLTATSLEPELGDTQRFTGSYVLHLLLRILLEAGFAAAHYYLFGFYIPRRFLCQQSPCTTQVDCYISRPTEKTVMLNFMFGAGAVSSLLNVADLICAIKSAARKKTKENLLEDKAYKEEQYCLSPSGGSTCMEANLPLLPRVLGAEPGSFRKRDVSKPNVVGRPGDGRSPLTPCCDSSFSPGPPGFNVNDGNLYHAPLEEGQDGEGSEVALCPPEPPGTPRSILVNKRNRLKPPPPPPRRVLCSLDAAAASRASVCTRKVGQYTVVEMTASDQQSNTEESQDKRSEWV